MKQMIMVPTELHENQPVRFGWWSCTLEQRGLFRVLVCRRAYRQGKHVFVVDEIGGGEWGIVVDDDEAEVLVSVIALPTHIVLIDHQPIIAKARSLERLLAM